MWAFIYLHPNRENDSYIPDSAQSSLELLESGWIRVSSVVDLDVRNIDSISQTAWDAWLTIVTSCARQVPPEKEMTVSTGSRIRDYFKTTVGDFVEKYCSKRASDAYWGKLMGESLVRSLIRSVLQEDEAARRMNANLATHMANKVNEPGERRAFGRVLKNAWMKEADHASFNNVTFVHWNDINRILNLLREPRGRDEISTLPYRKPPWKPFSLGWSRVIGVILKGHPTLIANADLNSNAFRKAMNVMDLEKIEQREKSSGWNKYPGMKSPGSEHDFWGDLTTQLARSWEDHLVYSADEIAPAEKINFDAGKVFSPWSRDPDDVSMGWPEALIDNWRVEGIVIPDDEIKVMSIEEFLEAFKRHEVPAGISVYDERGEERSITR